MYKIIDNILYAFYYDKIIRYNFDDFTKIDEYTCNLNEIGITQLNDCIVNGNNINVCYKKLQYSGYNTIWYDNYTSVILPQISLTNANCYIKLK